PAGGGAGRGDPRGGHRPPPPRVSAGRRAGFFVVGRRGGPAGPLAAGPAQLLCRRAVAPRARSERPGGRARSKNPARLGEALPRPRRGEARRELGGLDGVAPVARLAPAPRRAPSS